jgi:repressor LexA
MPPRHAADTDALGEPLAWAILGAVPSKKRPDPAELTDAQRSVLKKLEERESTEEGMASLRQLADYPPKRALPGTSRIVGVLERAGWIARVKAKTRGQADRIYALHYLSGRPTRFERHREPELLHLPVKGRIAAGRPIEALATEEREVVVPAEWVRQGRRLGGDFYMLEVAGDSMVEDGIFDGDFVLVREQSSVEDGEKAVALLPDGTATLKRIYRLEGKRVELRPANPKYKSVIVSEVTIQGHVIGLLRFY